MKHFGNTFEYEKQRNDDLMRAYREVLHDVDVIKMPEIFKAVVNSPAARFWVSEERAAIVIAQMAKGHAIDKMRPMKKEMFQEIYNRVLQLQTIKPHLSLAQLVVEVIRQPAPKFYLTPGSAKVIISKIKKAWYEERKRKLRHLF